MFRIKILLKSKKIEHKTTYSYYLAREAKPYRQLITLKKLKIQVIVIEPIKNKNN